MAVRKKTISKVMSELARRRKNPYMAFKDPALASEAGKSGWTPERRARQAQLAKAMAERRRKRHEGTDEETKGVDTTPDIETEPTEAEAAESQG